MRRLRQLGVLVLIYALGILLPASPWQMLADGPIDAHDRAGEVHAWDGAPVSSHPDADGSDRATPIQLFEDDVLHEDLHCLLLPLRLAVAPPVVMEPDSIHPGEVDRPPLIAG